MEYLQTFAKSGAKEASFYISSGSSISIETEAAIYFDKENILRGNLEWIPDPKQAKVQVYFCSNPMDSKLERHEIMTKVKSKIKKKFETDYDIELKIIDMNAGLEYGAITSAEERLKQIEKCQQESLSTCFIAMIGHKYWALSTHPSIDVQVFNILRQTSKRYSIPDAVLLDDCYKKDDNSIPPAYILKIKKDHQYDNKTHKLDKVLKLAAERAFQDDLLTKEQSDMFLTSCFKKELNKGLFEAQEKYLANSVCYIRTIEGMEVDMNLERVNCFIDILSSNVGETSYVNDEMVDEAAARNMELIREVEIPKVITESQSNLKVYKCQVKWVPQVGLQAQTQVNYLDDFSNEIYNVIIKTAIPNIQDIKDSQEYSEILCHCYIAKSLHERYQEISTDAMKDIHCYINDQTNKPLILQGPKASGKSFLMANVASEVMEWFENDVTPICVTRFIGQTYLSSYMVLLLDSICSQLESYFNISNGDRYYTDSLYLKKRLLTLLENANYYQPIIILIDGIDHLEDIFNFQTWSSWLPINLPEYVKVIVSMDSSCTKVNDLLQDLRIEGFENVSVQLINKNSYSQVLRHMLASENRCITPGQHTFAIQAGFLDKRITTTTPLMADIVHAHAKRWSSTTNINLKTLGVGEKNSLHIFMFNLEEKYGEEFVKLACCLITVSKFGITESDLEDILTSSKLVENEILNQNLDKENPSIPEGVITLRISNFLEDLSFLLAQKYIGGCKVICWSNYLTSDIISSLYFTDKSTKKTIVNTLTERYLNYISHGTYQVCCDVPLKTLHVALSLPFLLEQTDNQTSALKTCYLNFFWLSIMMKTYGILFILFNLKLAYGKYCEQALLIVEQCIRISLPTIARSPTSFSGEILSRALPFSTKFPLLKDLIIQSTSANSTSVICPAGIIGHSPGAPLRVSFNENFPIASGLTTYETQNGFGLVYCTEKHIKWFNMLTGESIKEMAFSQEITWMKLSSDSQHIVIYLHNDQTLFIIKQKSGSCQNKFNLKDYFGDDNLLSNCGENYLAIWSTINCDQVVVIDIHQGVIIHSYNCKHPVEKCLISDNEQFVFNVHLPQTISIFDIKHEFLFCTLQPETETSDKIVDIYDVFSQYFISVYESGSVHVWEFNRGQTFKYITELNSRHYGQDQSVKVINTCLSKNNKQLAVVKSQDISIWNMETGSKNLIQSRKDEKFLIANFQNNYLLVAMSNSHLGIYVWKLERDYPASCVAILDGHTSNMCKLLVPYSLENNKNKWAISVSGKNTINVWNLENVNFIPTPTITGRPILKVLTVGEIAVSIDNTSKIAVWNILNGNILFYLEHNSPVIQCVVAKNGFKIITADSLGFQYIWDLESGLNLFKIKGPKVSALVISPNEQIIVSVFEEDTNEETTRAAARVWRLDTAQFVCTFNYTLQDAQITSENTFVVGISSSGRLNAISVWMGRITKVLGDSTSTVISLQALSKHDQVITLDSRNQVVVWSLKKEEILILLHINQEDVSSACFCESGAIMLTVDRFGNMKALDVKRGNMISIRSHVQPLMIEIGRKGLYFAFVSASPNPNTPETDLLYDLNVVKVTTSHIIATYPLESVPTCMYMSPSGRRVAIGTAEGKVLVFNINTTDVTPVDPANFQAKETQRKVFDSELIPDEDWNDHEPNYDESFTPSQVSSSSSSYSLNTKKQTEAQPNKMKIHLGPMKMQKSQPNKSVNMSRISNSSKVKVFM